MIRRSDPADRRRRLVELTESGAALFTEMFDTGERITDDILRASGVDVAQFRGSLRVLIRAMDPAAPRVETTNRASGRRLHPDRAMLAADRTTHDAGHAVVHAPRRALAG